MYVNDFKVMGEVIAMKRFVFFFFFLLLLRINSLWLLIFNVTLIRESPLNLFCMNR